MTHPHAADPALRQVLAEQLGRVAVRLDGDVGRRSPRERDREVAGAGVQLEDAPARGARELGDARAQRPADGGVRLREAEGRELERLAIGPGGRHRRVADRGRGARARELDARACDDAARALRVEAREGLRRKLALPRQRDDREPGRAERHARLAAAVRTRQRVAHERQRRREAWIEHDARVERRDVLRALLVEAHDRRLAAHDREACARPVTEASAGAAWCVTSTGSG